MNKRTKHSRLAFVANPKPADLAETVRVPWTVEYVTVINVCHLLQAMYGPNHWTDRRTSYEQRCLDMQAWCSRHGVGYYAACREDFSMHGAKAAATAQGTTTIVVEDMS